MKSIDPTTGRVLADHPDHDAAEIERRMGAASSAFVTWRRLSFAERGAVLGRTASRLRLDRDRLARLMTSEMGKPIVQAESEVEKCAWVCEHFAEHAARDLADQRVATDASVSYVRHEPLGVLLAVMPWNFPFWQVFRCAAPALMAGNTVLLKHASNVPGCALAIEQVFRDAGAPVGSFATLLVSSSTAEALVDRAEIAALSLTGSESAGVALGARAGAAIKKSVMELGGSDAFLVLADADPTEVAEHATAARLINNGESCIAAKRFIVEAAIAPAFEAAFVARMAAVTVGDPLDRATALGPLAREDLVVELHRQVEASIARGARVGTGGRRLERPGFFYAPTVLTAVEPGMPVFDEETFGPVAAVIRARDTAHAIELANRSRYGLGASVWTRDPKRGEELTREIEAGAVFVNGPVKSDPRLPFGGVKRSGFGRELGASGIREFVNVKTVWIR